MPNLYLETDPAVPETLYRWPFVYLHGAAEKIFEDITTARSLPCTPYDIFLADTPMPTEPGLHAVNLYSHPAIAHLSSVEHRTMLIGRVVLLNDYKNHPYLMNPSNW